MSKTVKNITKKDLAIPDVGVVKAGDTVKVPNDFNNPNFKEEKATPKTATTAAPKKRSTSK
jgi:hypothetical protein